MRGLHAGPLLIRGRVWLGQRVSITTVSSTAIFFCSLLDEYPFIGVYGIIGFIGHGSGKGGLDWVGFGHRKHQKGAEVGFPGCATTVYLILDSSRMWELRTFDKSTVVGPFSMISQRQHGSLQAHPKADRPRDGEVLYWALPRRQLVS